MNTLTKVLGILGLLVAVCVFTAIREPDAFLLPYNLENLILRTALFGIISIGVAFVIITGGIDLSIGSVIGLVGCLLPMFLNVSYIASQDEFVVTRLDKNDKQLVLIGDLSKLTAGDQLHYLPEGEKRVRKLTVAAVDEGTSKVTTAESPRGLEAEGVLTAVYLDYMNPALAIALVLLISMAIGLSHGLLITKLGLQPFVVTLCGLLIYRGVARGITGDTTQGFGRVFDDGLRQLGTGKLPITENFGLPIPFLFLAAVAALAAVFLNMTIYGRYMLAVGRNERAARYSGIHTDRIVILAYVLCSLLAGIGGVFFALRLNSVQPSSHGNFYELYAIAAAVLGGCSLRGGEGTILGVVIGAAVMRVLYNSISLLGIPTNLDFAIIGGVILLGVIVDEVFRRIASRRRSIFRNFAARIRSIRNVKGQTPDD